MEPNELQIKPLLTYEVIFEGYQGKPKIVEQFTAESHDYCDRTQTLSFYRTGNIIRQYFDRPSRMIIRPYVNEETE